MIIGLIRIRIIRCRGQWTVEEVVEVAACCRAVPKKYSKLIERTKRLLQLVPQPGTSRRAKGTSLRRINFRISVCRRFERSIHIQSGATAHFECLEYI